MAALIKPRRLQAGSTIATISPCNGWAGDSDIHWRYALGKARLQALGLNVVAAPNSLRGSAYLSENPKARAEDIMWAFENKNVDAVIANVGGNDSIKVIPYIDRQSIRNHPKILIGYSDVMNLHLLCYQCGLSTFYGANLLSPIAEAQGWHAYSKKWFVKTLFEPAPIGNIPSAKEWTSEPVDYRNPHAVRRYLPNTACYELVQGDGVARGKLFGGHTGLMDLAGTPLALDAKDFEDVILFLEDIESFYTPEFLETFFDWLGRINALQMINGILLGKADSLGDLTLQKKRIVKIVGEKYGRSDLPVLYGLNFGHSSPVFVLPYGAKAEIDCQNGTFAILENGVI